MYYPYCFLENLLTILYIFTYEFDSINLIVYKSTQSKIISPSIEIWTKSMFMAYHMSLGQSKYT